jgi:PGF-pre-PGF domain-containing protein
MKTVSVFNKIIINKGSKMKTKIELLIIFCLILMISSPVIASAREITVDDNTGADFVSIQEAVNNSVPGDKIIVKPGTYTENVLVNVSELTITSDSKNNDGQVESLGSVFQIEADNVTISGFKGGKINLENARNCVIKGNNKMSVSLYNASYNTISENLFLENIAVYWQSDMNKLIHNTIYGSIKVYPETSGNLIAENSVSNGEGIHVYCCGFYNVVSGNTVSNCYIGVYTYDQRVDILNNRISDCYYGIELAQASAEIYNNTILNCNTGINFMDGSHANIISNTIMSCEECGISDLEGDGGILIYNNYFNNTLNVRVGTGIGNIWNNSLTSGTSIAGGPFIGGNFWAKPDGNGFSQICMDLDGNGIGDLPYKIYEDPDNIHEDIFDYLPLVSLSSMQNSVSPTANFAASVTNGTAPLTVKFLDLSRNAVLWNWEFGDGATSTEQNPLHNYPASGSYIVNLTVSNKNGMDSKIKEITVQGEPGQEKVFPVADFSSNVTSGYAPLDVQFTDLSKNATGWYWDFGDGITSTEQNPLHNYSAAGKYIVNLTVINSNGTASRLGIITVLQRPKIFPVANIGTNVTSGYAPLDVQFTDLSKNATGRSWDFNNDWQGDSGDAAPVYVFTEPGSYNVNLVAINENGTTTKTITITVLEESSSGGNRGGSAGGSPEPQENVAIKELSQTSIFTGQPVKFEFPQKVTAVESITFNSNKSVGKTTTIVEMLKNKSTLVLEVPADEVYKYLNIWVGNSGYATEKNIENAVVNFKVAKSWVHDRNINKSTITLNRYNDKIWNQVPTTLSSEDANFLYLTSQTPGFSPFAITGKTAATGIAVQPANGNKTQWAMNYTQNNAINTTTKTDQIPERTQSSNTSGKEGTKMPDFEIISGIICLLSVFLYNKR